jgi:flagellar hook-basal body complex protein FliE
MANIQGINGIAGVAPLREKAPAAGGESKDFGKIFADAVGSVEQYREKAETAANGFMNGETEEIHQVILAGQRAEIAFETFLQVRNKVVQAYQEVMRMQM